MQSSNNLIKSALATAGDNKIISTKYNRKNFSSQEVELREEEIIDVEAIVKSYENIGISIVKNAKKEAEEIAIKALESSALAEKSAYEDGYKKGTENGYEDGYKKGYEKSINDLESKVKEDIEKAEEILSLATEKYENYVSRKRSEILNLALEMAKIISSKELEMSEGILHLIEPILENAKGEENIVIKCNQVHSEAIKEKLNYYQVAYAIPSEIFLLEDKFMEPGNCEIQKKTGKVIVGIDIALEKLEEIILK